MKGVRNTRGGCGWKSQARLGNGEGLSQRIAEYDPVNCEFVIARGTRKSWQSRGARSLETEESRGKDANPVGAVISDPSIRRSIDAPECNESGMTCDSATVLNQVSGPVPNYSFQRAETFDPIDIMVVGGYLGMESYTNPSTNCVTSGRASWLHRWFTATFWYKEGSSSFVSEWLTCQGFGAITYGVYSNEWFCQTFTYFPGSATVEFVNKMTVRPAYTDFEGTIWRYGQCSTLLRSQIDYWRV